MSKQPPTMTFDVPGCPPLTVVFPELPDFNEFAMPGCARIYSTFAAFYDFKSATAARYEFKTGNWTFQTGIDAESWWESCCLLELYKPALVDVAHAAAQASAP